MNTDILATIVAHKKEEVAAAKRRVPEIRLRSAISPDPMRSRFKSALNNTSSQCVKIIAEIKRASPSKGLIRCDLDPATYAIAYEQGGAAAVSVLTDHRFFKGSPEDLSAVKAVVKIPVLRKDFLISSYQLYESSALGADAILLIVRILSTEQLKDFLQLAEELNLDALVEVHSEEDLENAGKAGARLIGINNRNLSTFETHTEKTIHMASLLAPHQIGVSESGIRNRDDIEIVRRAGIHNFLIGESLVRADCPKTFLKTLITGDVCGKNTVGP
jgi:indole-3-glycerol phosphate synthase